MSALTSRDYPVCAEMFRRTYGAEIGTDEAADVIGMPKDQPNRQYWRSQVEWVATSGWAYGLAYSEDSRRRYRDLPEDLRDHAARAHLPGRAPELPPITDEDNIASE